MTADRRFPPPSRRIQLALLLAPLLVASYLPVIEAGPLDAVCDVESDLTGTCRLKWVQNHRRNLDGWSPFTWMVTLPGHDLSVVGGSSRETPTGGSCALFADDLHTGESRWRFTYSGDPMIGSKVVDLTADHEMVYVACSTSIKGGMLFALEAATGRVVWQHPIPWDEGLHWTDHLAQISVSEGRVWLILQVVRANDHPCWGSTGEGELWGLDRITGALQDVIRIAPPGESWDIMVPVDVHWSAYSNTVYASAVWGDHERWGFGCKGEGSMALTYAYDLDTQVLREVFRLTSDDIYDKAFEITQVNETSVLLASRSSLRMIRADSAGIEWTYAPKDRFVTHAYDSAQHAIYTGGWSYGITKVDASSGVPVWSQVYGEGWDMAWELDVSSDGERIFAAGSKYKRPSIQWNADADMWSFEIDTRGTVQNVMRYSNLTHNGNDGFRIDFVEEHDMVVVAGQSGLDESYCCHDTHYSVVAYDMSSRFEPVSPL